MSRTKPVDRIYLDFNATAPLRRAVRERMLAALDHTGNPSSVHAEGRRARACIENARRDVARLVGTSAESVTFTSGATEGAALALTPDLMRGTGGGPAERLLLGATEHPAVARGHRFAAGQVDVIPVRADGVIDLDRLAAMVDHTAGRAVVALQAANGETGVVQPVAEAAALVHGRGGLLVCDAVQAVGRMDCGTAALKADVILLSAHKLGGPQGVGAVVTCGADVTFGAPLVRGGGQERGLRSGTENGAGIAGFAAAAVDVLATDDVARLAALRDRLETALRGVAPDLVIFGREARRLPNTSAFAVPGLPAATAMIALDLAGFAVSTGSACSSGKVSRSPVLEAMGVDAHISSGMIRVSLGWSSTPDHVERFIVALEALLNRMRTRAIRSAA